MPAQPRPIIPLLAAWACLHLAAATAGAVERSAAESFQTYFNYHRSRIDAAFHPDANQREAGEKNVAALTPEMAGLDPGAIREALRDQAREYLQALYLLRQFHDSNTPKLLAAESELVALVRRRDDPDTAGEDKPASETIGQLEKMIAWLQERDAFFQKEITALAGEPSEAERALDTYRSLIRLEEARVLAKNVSGAVEKRRALAAVELQAQRLQGKDLGAARARLGRKEISKAAQFVGKKLEPIPARLRALSNTYPAESHRLREKQRLYQEELDALRALRDAKRWQRKP